MSFLENEEEKKKSAVWDWIIGLGLLALVGGFTFYYQYQKRSSVDRFAEADSLYQAGDLRAAAKLYEELKTASYLTARDDSVLYERLFAIAELEDEERRLVGLLRARLAAGDSAGVRAEIEAATFRGLLRADEQRWLDSAKRALGVE